MSEAAAAAAMPILQRQHQPTFFFGTSSSGLKPLKPIPPHSQFPVFKSHLFGGFVSRNPGFRSIRSLPTMPELLRLSALGRFNGDDEGGVGLEEEEDGEPFVDGSSGIRPNVTPAGFESTLNRLSKWLVAALFGAVILCRHDAEALWAAMGSVLNSGLSVVLKRILNQERPTPVLRSDPGMPSSHAQSIFFSVIFVIFSLMEWLGTNGITFTLSGFILSIGTYLTWLRVSQQFHTSSQVVVGAVLGAIFSAFWLWSWNAIVLEVFISTLWVRILILLSAVAFCLGFLAYVILYWFNYDER